jgi:hypothetical protein
MKFTIIDQEQRSPAWLQARAGRLTGSRAKDVLSKIKSGEAAARRDYRLQLVAEILTGAPQEDVFVNAAMQWGIDCEPIAFAAYEAATGEMVRRTGFICADDLMVGCSLDGDISDFAGLLEVKCPKTSTHLSYLEEDRIPSTHLPQLTHNLWVTEAKWIDFVSYDPRLPKELQLFVKRLMATDVDIAAYATEAHNFLCEVQADVARIQGLARKRQAA